MTANKPHYLRGQAKNFSPQVVISFDTESTRHTAGIDEVHTLRCWDAVTRCRGQALRRNRELTWSAGESADDLADMITTATGISKETWIVAHNLHFDLAVTSLPPRLVDRGWSLDAWHLGNESTWWRLSQDKRQIVLTDSWSWVRSDLATVARDMHRRKVDLPDDDDSLEAWHKRCRRDVDLLDQTMRTILDWWDSSDLGRFAITGPACGWAAMRAKIEPKSIVVGPDGDRTAFERSAIVGGRREVYRVGVTTGEWCADYDLRSAHAMIAAHLPLPTACVGAIGAERVERLCQVAGQRDVIANCVVTSDIPVVTARIDSELWWPTGQWNAVLTGVEIRHARAQGATVDVGEGYEYRMTTALAPWAIWTLGLMADKTGKTPDVVKRMLKGWSRSVTGKFAAHGSEVVADTVATIRGWHLTTGTNLSTGRSFDILTIAGREITVEHDADAADCSPAMLAFVEAYCRTALGQLLAKRTPSQLLQCNTDGWWQRKAVRSAAWTMDDVPWPHQVVRKQLAREVVIVGPSHIATAVKRQVAGLPATAASTPDGAWTWHDWPSLRMQLQRTETDQYRRTGHTMRMADHYVRRWVLDTGDTVPVTAYIDDNGQNTIQPWSLTRHRLATDELNEHQDHLLAPLQDETAGTTALGDGVSKSLPGRSLLTPRKRKQTSVTEVKHDHSWWLRF